MNNTKRLTIEPLTSKYLEFARELHNENSTLLHLTDVEYITPKQQQLWFESLSSSKTSKRYLASETRTNSPVGIFREDLLDLKNGSVMVGLDITPMFRGNGFSYEIYDFFLEYYFKHLRINRVWLQVAETNTVAFWLYKKLGFKIEGKLREAIFRNGQYVDYVVMSILKKEYVNVIQP